MTPLRTKCRDNGIAATVVGVITSDGRLDDGVRLDWIAPLDDQRIGLGERKIGQLADMSVERSGEYFGDPVRYFHAIASITCR
jgi:hypothetical protein